MRTAGQFVLMFTCRPAGQFVVLMFTCRPA